MRLTKIASVLLAVLLVATAGAAAMPGNAPTDSQAGQAQDDTDDAANASAASEQTMGTQATPQTSAARPLICPSRYPTS